MASGRRRTCAPAYGLRAAGEVSCPQPGRTPLLAKRQPPSAGVVASGPAAPRELRCRLYADNRTVLRSQELVVNDVNPIRQRTRQHQKHKTATVFRTDSVR